jgi:hypothetical protein
MYRKLRVNYTTLNRDTLDNIVMKTELKRIAVIQANYLRLKSLGSTGDSFNDVITEVLDKISHQEGGAGIAALRQPPRGRPEMTHGGPPGHA